MKAYVTALFTDKETGELHSHGDIIELNKERMEDLKNKGKVRPYDGDKPAKAAPKPKPDKTADKADKNIETEGDKVKGDDLKDNDKFHTKKEVKPEPKKK
jgi:hypothetical protein